MNLPERKRLRLKEYDYSKPGAYFVTICTQNRRCILSNIIVGADVRLAATANRSRAFASGSCLRGCGNCALPFSATGGGNAQFLGGPSLELTPTGKTVERYLLSTNRIPGVHMDKYVIMPNHVHMILVVEAGIGPPRASAPTSRLVPNAIGAFKRLVHRSLNQEIFQRSYHEHVIRNEEDYRQIWEYIENNPAKWSEDRYYIS